MGIDVLRIRSLGLPDDIVTRGLAEPPTVDDLATASWTRVREMLDTLGGPYSYGLTAALRDLGWDAVDLVLDAPVLTEAWTREHGPLPDGVSGPRERLVLAAILRLRPRIVIDMNLKVMAPDFADHVRSVAPWVERIVGAPNTMKRLHRALACDVVLTPSRPLIRLLREAGVGQVEEFHHAFDPAILDRIGRVERQPSAIFSGSLPHSFGAGRFEVIERALAARVIDAYVPPVEADAAPPAQGSTLAGMLAGLPPRVLAAVSRRTGRGSDAFDQAALRHLGMADADRTATQSTRLDLASRFPDRVHRSAHGLEMFRLLAASRLVLHHEVGTSPASLRLYEATGVGATLITNRVPDLASRFEPGVDVLVYDRPEEAIDLVRELLADETRAARVGSSGQQRTLRDHTVEVRAAELDRILANL